MGSLGQVRIGHRAPDFRCEAVIKGQIEGKHSPFSFLEFARRANTSAEVTLSDYVSPSNKQWLILLFIPAAFSFVCPTEVLAFQNYLEGTSYKSLRHVLQRKYS